MLTLVSYFLVALQYNECRGVPARVKSQGCLVSSKMSATAERAEFGGLRDVPHDHELRAAAQQEATARDLAYAYQLQLDEIITDTDGIDAETSGNMFEPDLEDCRQRSTAIRMQVILQARKPLCLLLSLHF